MAPTTHLTSDGFDVGYLCIISNRWLHEMPKDSSVSSTCKSFSSFSGAEFMLSIELSAAKEGGARLYLIELWWKP